MGGSGVCHGRMPACQLSRAARLPRALGEPWGTAWGMPPRLRVAPFVGVKPPRTFTGTGSLSFLGGRDIRKFYENTRNDTIPGYWAARTAVALFYFVSHIQLNILTVHTSTAAGTRSRSSQARWELLNLAGRRLRRPRGRAIGTGWMSCRCATWAR